MVQIHRRWHWAFAAILFVAAGYFSNAIAARQCEQKTSIWLDDRLARRPTNWPGRHASSELAEYRLPWIVTVDYVWVVSDTGGEWGTRYYLSLFRFALPIPNHITVQS